MKDSGANRALAKLMRAFPLDGYVQDPRADVYSPRYDVAMEWELLAALVAGNLSTLGSNLKPDWGVVQDQIEVVEAQSTRLPEGREKEMCRSVIAEMRRAVEEYQKQA